MYIYLRLERQRDVLMDIMCRFKINILKSDIVLYKNFLVLILFFSLSTKFVSNLSIYQSIHVFILLARDELFKNLYTQDLVELRPFPTPLGLHPNQIQLNLLVHQIMFGDQPNFCSILDHLFSSFARKCFRRKD